MNGLGFITSRKNNLCLWCIQLNRKHYGAPNPFVESSIVRRIVHRSSDRPIVRRIAHPFTRSQHPGLGGGILSLEGEPPTLHRYIENPELPGEALV